MTSLLDQLIAEAGRIILGKERILRLSLAYMLARGDLLIEDLPGVGKTTLANLLADEINRATPNAQSALLEAIEDRQITVEGGRHPSLSSPPRTRLTRSGPFRYRNPSWTDF